MAGHRLVAGQQPALHRSRPRWREALQKDSSRDVEERRVLASPSSCGAPAASSSSCWLRRRAGPNVGKPARQRRRIPSQLTRRSSKSPGARGLADAECITRLGGPSNVSMHCLSARLASVCVVSFCGTDATPEIRIEFASQVHLRIGIQALESGCGMPKSRGSDRAGSVTRGALGKRVHRRSRDPDGTRACEQDPGAFAIPVQGGADRPGRRSLGWASTSWCSRPASIRISRADRGAVTREDTVASRGLRRIVGAPLGSAPVRQVQLGHRYMNEQHEHAWTFVDDARYQASSGAYATKACSSSGLPDGPLLELGEEDGTASVSGRGARSHGIRLRPNCRDTAAHSASHSYGAPDCRTCEPLTDGRGNATTGSHRRLVGKYAPQGNARDRLKRQGSYFIEAP